MSNSKHRPDPPLVSSVFTVDSGEVNPIEMPSITKLLNRKRLGMDLTASNTHLPPPPPAQFNLKPNPSQSAPTQSCDDSEPTQLVTGMGPPPKRAPQVSHTVVQKAGSRSAARKKKPLLVWDRSSLQNSQDAFLKGVFYLLEKGARHALLLMPAQGPVSDSQAFTPFSAICAYMAEEREALWQGLTLHSALVPETWSKLFTSGCVEVPSRIHSGAHSSSESELFLRKAFALNNHEWLILIRCGSARACTGFLAIISGESMAAEVSAAFRAPGGNTKEAIKKAA